MGAPKGHPRYGGRQKGTPNKDTLNLAQFLEKKNFSPIEEIIKRMPRLADVEAIKVCLELLQYIYPKRKALEVSDPGGEPLGSGSSDALEKFKESTLKVFKERQEKVSG